MEKNRLEILRKAASLTTGDVAKALDVSIREYRSFESGSLIPSIGIYKKIALLYKMPLLVLLEDTDAESIRATIEMNCDEFCNQGIKMVVEMANKLNGWQLAQLLVYLRRLQDENQEIRSEGK